MYFERKTGIFNKIVLNKAAEICGITKVNTDDKRTMESGKLMMRKNSLMMKSGEGTAK